MISALACIGICSVQRIGFLVSLLSSQHHRAHIFHFTAAAPSFKRAVVIRRRYVPPGYDGPMDSNTVMADGIHCVACKEFHPAGLCPIKLAGPEHCNLCGIAHFGASRICPHIQSETQVSGRTVSSPTRISRNAAPLVLALTRLPGSSHARGAEDLHRA